MTITDNLTQTRDQWRQLGAGAWLLYDFVLAHGKAYQGQLLPRRYAKRAPKACFYNSRQLVLGSRTLTHCQGYAMGKNLPIPFEHAWALDPRGRVIETTLSDPSGYEYYGITLERSWLRREWRYMGVLTDEMGIPRIEVLRAVAPDWTQDVFQPELEKHAFLSDKSMLS
jgi:hypothetical protein